MNYDWADRIILKLGRKYRKDEAVAGMREILSRALIELGKSEAYCAELEYKIKQLEGRLNFPTDIEKKYRSLENELKRTQKKAAQFEKANKVILSRTRISSDPNLYP